MKYIVYKTVNKVNNKYYIGKHAMLTEDFDGYFGSSEVVNNAIAKYGVENFERTTIAEFDSEEECYSAEELYVGDLWMTDKNCYNKQPGGKGFSSGKNHYTKGNGFSKQHIENLTMARRKRPPHSEETKRKMSESRTGQKRTEEQKLRMSAAQSGENNPMYGKTHSAAKRKEISEKMKGTMKGTKHYNNGIKRIRCFPGDEPEGYNPGYKL
jgi:group I intron endonuclease